MKGTVLAIVVFIGCGTTFSQPLLDGSSAPTVGTSLDYLRAYYVDVTGTGVDQTWDLTFTGITGGDSIDFIDPASSIDGASFPDCDVVYSTEGLEYYTDVQPTGLYKLGLHDSQATETWTDPYRYLAFPCAMDTSWTDDYTVTYVYLGDTYNGSGSGTFTALGYGDVQLPWGTVTNVLRVDADEDYIETGGGDVFTSTAHYVYFFKPGLGHFVARTTTRTDSLNGAPNSFVQKMDYIDQNQVGLMEYTAQSLGLQVIYDPLSDLVTVVLSATGETELDMIDAEGRVLIHQALGDLDPGIQRTTVDVHALPIGVYAATVHNVRGERGSQLFAVAR